MSQLPRPVRQGQFIREFMVVHQLLATRLNRALGASSLTLTHVSFLSHLANSGGAASPSDISRAMEVNQPAVSKTMKYLEALGAVRVDSDDADARRRLVQLTPSGQTLLDEAMRAMDPTATSALSILDDAALADLTATLSALSHHLDADHR